MSVIPVWFRTQPTPKPKRRNRDSLATKLRDACAKWGCLLNNRPNPLLRILRGESQFTQAFTC